MQVKLFLIRGFVAIAWALAFATTFDSLTTGAAVLLVLYPVIDLVASIVDARHQTGRAQRVLVVNAAVSAVAAIAIGIAATGDKGDVLAVFGIWALLTGIAQFVTALRRRAVFGWQWPMLAAGGVSTIGGVFFTIMATTADPTLMPLVVYAATGGIDFIIEAWLLRRKLRKGASTEPAEQRPYSAVLHEVRS
jgi:uncharacterized membrane protein HdeD (DUF308 family)